MTAPTAKGCTCGGVSTDTGWGDIHTNDCTLTTAPAAKEWAEERARATHIAIEHGERSPSWVERHDLRPCEGCAIIAAALVEAVARGKRGGRIEQAKWCDEHHVEIRDKARAEGERAGQAVSGLLLLIANSLLGRTNTEEEILLSECIRALRSGAGELPRCAHGAHLKDWSGEILEPSCGCAIRREGEK